MIQDTRIKILNKEAVKGNRDFILYWMQASQREEYNQALEYAVSLANKWEKPLIVYFGLTHRYPEANLRHYVFLLEGLKETRERLEKRGIRMIIRKESPENGIGRISSRACLVVVDRGYTRIQRDWRKKAAEGITCPLYQVESDVVVPVEIASSKEEYMASTFRPKIRRYLKDYLIPLKKQPLRRDSLGVKLESLTLDNLDKELESLEIDRSVSPSSHIFGGTSKAKAKLSTFIKKGLNTYEELKNDPNADNVSGMSPYLHFGQISPLYIALQVNKNISKGKDAYLEELIIRRELSMNFVFYNPRYDSFEGLPSWAKSDLIEHMKDQREYEYSLEDLERAQTHDPYWNAAQKEMVQTGKMHGYMRMYWGKKILEWIKNPAEAFQIALYLNNKYEIDGRDPNGFTGVAWCFGKHDRPWPSRPVFGKVRSMSSSGLQKKFDVDGYVKKVKSGKKR